MRSFRGIIAAAVGLSLAVASTASAQFFIASGSGTYEITTPGSPRTASAALALSATAGPFDFTSAKGEFETNSNNEPVTVTGTMTLFTSGGDELVIGLEGFSFGVSQTFENASGDWAMFSGTGAFAGLSGSGTWGYSVDFSGGFTGPQPMTAVFGGTLVPSPAPLALMSIACGAAATRRRRSKTG